MEKSCVFCDPKNLAAGMIAETEAFYVTATKGQITEGGYVLIVPKRHSDCVGAMRDEEAAALAKLTEAVSGTIKEAYGKYVTLFEHGVVGQTIRHTHIHLVPADLDIARRVRNDFPMAENDTMESLDQLPALYRNSPDKTYLFWKRDGGPATIAWNPSAPPQYLRIVTANLLGRPERANWRTMDPELDAKLVDETISKLRPFFQDPPTGKKISRR